MTPKTRELQEVALTIDPALNLNIGSALQYGKGGTSIQNPNLHTFYKTIGCLIKAQVFHQFYRGVQYALQ